MRDNYRPVSLLSCVSKLFERAVFKHVFNFLRDTNAISLKQSGFIPGDSTVYQLVHLYHIFSEALDKKKDIRVVFCDISKAFDRVWHTGLLSKLSKIGIDGGLYKWFENYLSDRYQRVTIGGQTSSWGQIKSGVPQGSVLGPLLFLIYINDIASVTEFSEVRLFADDTILYLFVDNPVANSAALNRDLEKLSKWASDWLVKFSPTKTKAMTISWKTKLPNFPPLIMSGTPLEEVQSHKHLGLTFSKDLDWREHIENLVTKTNQTLGVINALKFKLDRNTLEKLYYAFIRSKLEYGNIVWDDCSQELIDLLEQVQYRASKIVSGAIHRTSHDFVYNELGWETLEQRRKKQRLKVFYKAVNKEAPLYLQQIIPNRRNVNRYQLRNAEFNYEKVRCRTASYQNTFLPKTVNDWNKLDNQTKQSSSFEVFSKCLNEEKNQNQPPSWYLVGKRKENIRHAQLRMHCSPLNEHLSQYIHVVDDQSCACGHDCENNKHFLLECPLYNTERGRMFNELRNIDFEPSLNNLLYGNSDLYSEETNKKAFKIVQKFINNTERFG